MVRGGDPLMAGEQLLELGRGGLDLTHQTEHGGQVVNDRHTITQNVGVENAGVRPPVGLA